VLKVSENPPIVWPEEKSIADFVGTWWVAHTKARNEKAMAWQLVHKSVPYFLPMSWKVSRKSGRTIRSLLPLFSGYVFFCGGEPRGLSPQDQSYGGDYTGDMISQADSRLVPIETLLQLGKPCDAA
jgi:hypothetical protein